MTIKELKKLSRGRWNGSMKRSAVQQWHIGPLTLKEILLTLKINRCEFRRWVRWEYHHWVTKHKTGLYMTRETKLQELQKQLKVLEEKLQRSASQRSAIQSNGFRLSGF